VTSWTRPAAGLRQPVSAYSTPIGALGSKDDRISA